MKSNEFQELLDKLSTYQYGILYNDGKFVSDKEEIRRRDGTHIVVQTPDMMDEHKAGMCHDASIYVDKELTRLGILHKCVYIASNVEPMLPTHSFVMVFDDEIQRWFIVDVFASKDCIHTAGQFYDMSEGIDRRVASWIVEDNGGSANLDVFIGDHMPDGGIGFVEYSEKVVDSFDNYDFTKGYSHIEYMGTGVYQALKKSMDLAEWKKLLQSEDIGWLPKPPDYNGHYKSYFTMKGYKEFMQKVMPLVKQHLADIRLHEEYAADIDEKRIAYSDEFQVVVEKKDSKFDCVYEEVMNNVSNRTISDLDYMLFEKKLTRDGSCRFFDDFIVESSGITANMITEAVGYALNESADPDYYVKMPKKLAELTRMKDGDIIDRYDILTVFPEFSSYKFPKTYVLFFDFSRKDDVERIISSFLKLNDKKAIAYLKTAFMMAKGARGMHLSFRQFGVDVDCMLFNKPIYNERTIYHEWTHFFQVHVGDGFVKQVELSTENEESKNEKLKKFGLTMDAMREYFFSSKEYVTRLDNLLYMIHQAQKLPKYEGMNDFEFFNMFNDSIRADGLDSDVAKDILQIDSGFYTDIVFFICAKMCFEGDLFDKLCSDLTWRI